MPVPTYYFAADAIMVLAALLAAIFAAGERVHRVFPRWRLTAPGLLAFLSSLALVGYPDARALLDAQAALVGAVGFGMGAARGHFMAMDSDHTWRLVRLERGGDALLLALVLTLAAVLQSGVEIQTLERNPWEPTVELAMVLTAGYLLGRSLFAWFRAGHVQHIVLRED